MKRTVIRIDEALCNGCGNCIDGCHEGALQLIDGKSVMISDLYCDGLGACIGECPVGAIAFEEREAAPYDEEAVMERLAPKGEAVLIAHLRHLHEHNEHKWVAQGLDCLKKRGIHVDPKKIGITSESSENCVSGSFRPDTAGRNEPLACGCPGTMAREIRRPQAGFAAAPAPNAAPYGELRCSELRQFPVQLHLLNPQAGFLRDADLLLAADCTAFACGDFHNRFLRGKSLAIACPKLDSNTQTYVGKLTEMIDGAKINTLTVLVMEVPCCRGLVQIARQARGKARRHIPVKTVVLSAGGEVIDDQWI